MISTYSIPTISLPLKKRGQSYKKYKEELDKFLSLYIRYYDCRKRRVFNFFESFRDDFYDDPSYIYTVKYIYRKGLDLSEIRGIGPCSLKGIKKRPPRKEMFKKISKETRMPFMRWGSFGKEENQINSIKEIFKDYLRTN